MLIDEEEKKKREEEARRIINLNSIRDTINSINYANSNNIAINTKNDDEKYFIDKVNEANSIINGINPRQNVSGPTASEEDLLRSRQTTQRFLDLIDNNNDTIEADKQIDNSQNINTNIEENNSNEIETEESKKRKEIFNVVANGKKPTNLMTEQEKEQQKYQEEQNQKNIQEANSDKNFFSQIGKAIENLWLGIVGGGETAAYYAVNPNHTKQQELNLLAGKRDDIVVNEYINQLNEDKVNILKNIQKNKSPNINTTLKKEELRPVENTIYTPKISNELNEARDAFGDIEINGLRRDLSKSIAENQNKIVSNVNKIDNGLIKKIAELAPSAGNSLAGAGLSMINPYLGMSYFVISASGSYEFEGRNRGMSKEEARQYGSIMGYMEGATEYLEISKFVPAQINSLSKGKFGDFLKNVGLDMADNAVQEAIIDPVDELTAYITSGKSKNDYSTKEGWQQLGKDMIEDGFNGALSSILMGGITGGIGSSIRLYDKIRNGEKITNQELKDTLSDIQKSGIVSIKDKFKEAFNFQKEKLENNNEKIYTITNIDTQGNHSSLTQVIGEDIEVNNNKLLINPAVVYTKGYYNIIDSKSGLMIDSTMYDNKENAINSFKEKISNVDNATINEINRRATISQLSIMDKFQEMQEKAFENPGKLQKQTRIEFVQENENYNQQEAQQILNDFNVDYTANNSQYSGEELNTIITNNIATRIDNSIEENGNKTNYISTTNELTQFSETVNQIQDKSIYTDAETINTLQTVSDNIENINLINKNGETYLVSLDKNGNRTYRQKIDKTKYKGSEVKQIINTAINSADLSNIVDNTNTNIAQSSQNRISDSLNNETTNYTVENVKKITEPFQAQKEYTLNEMANIWNNEINAKDLDTIYDSNGNVQSYIAIEQDGDNLVVNRYDNNDNIIASEIIPVKNGKYTADAIKDTIEKVTRLYNEKETSKIQNKKNLKKKYSNATDLLTDKQADAEKSFNPVTSVNEISELKEINFNKISENEYIKLSKNIFKKYNMKRVFYNNDSNLKVKVILDDIKESAYKAFNNKYQNKLIKQHIEALTKIEDIISNAEEASMEIEKKNREKYSNWKYFTTQMEIENKPYLIQFDIAKKDDGYHFRLQRLVELNIKNTRDTASTMTNKQVGVDSRQYLYY